MKRRLTLILCALDALAWAALAIAAFFSGSDPATRDLDVLLGVAVTILFALTALPAALLAWRRVAPDFALVLALGFPAAFLLLFMIGVLALAGL